MPFEFVHFQRYYTHTQCVLHIYNTSLKQPPNWIQIRVVLIVQPSSNHQTHSSHLNKMKYSNKTLKRPMKLNRNHGNWILIVAKENTQKRCHLNSYTCISSIITYGISARTLSMCALCYAQILVSLVQVSVSFESKMSTLIHMRMYDYTLQFMLFITPFLFVSYSVQFFSCCLLILLTIGKFIEKCSHHSRVNVNRHTYFRVFPSHFFQKWSSNGIFFPCSYTSRKNEFFYIKIWVFVFFLCQIQKRNSEKSVQQGKNHGDKFKITDMNIYGGIASFWVCVVQINKQTVA